MFDTLDGDSDGKISGEKIDLTQLSNKMLDLLTPFLIKIEKETIEVEFEEFKAEIQDFIKVTNSCITNTYRILTLWTKKNSSVLKRK